jgi:MFS family permease
LSVTPPHSRRWWTLAVLALTQLVVVLDATIVTIALPEAQQELGLTDVERQWVVTAYVLVFGALLLLGGRIADYWGRKRAFMVGMIGFGLASAFGGLAQNGTELILARGLQGLFAALLAPAALALLTVTFSSGRDRNTAFAVFGIIGGSGAAVGLLLGGALTEFASSTSRRARRRATIATTSGARSPSPWVSARSSTVSASPRRAGHALTRSVSSPSALACSRCSC